MFTDVVDLRDFYAETVGQVTQRLLRSRLRELWPDVRGMRVAGLGYAVPFLRPFVDEAERVLALMPAAQGVLPWPNERANLATLVDEIDLPLADRSVDRLVMVHALECAEQVRPLLRANMFTPLRQARGLYLPPTRSRLLLSIAPTVERLGQRLFTRFAGVAMVEAGKQIYAGVAQPTVAARPRLRVAHSRGPSPAAGRTPARRSID